MVGLSSTRAFQWYVSRDLILNIWWDTKNWQYILIFEWISVSPDPLMLQKNWSPNDMCHVTSIWIFNEIRKHSIISLSFNNINKVITWLDSARRELSNDMCHVTSFWIFNEIRKIGNIYILIFEWISVSPDPLMLQKNWSPNDMCHVTSIWIFNEIRKHSIISLSFNNINKVITWLESARRELSNDMCHVTSFWIFNEIRKNGNISLFLNEFQYLLIL